MDQNITHKLPETKLPLSEILKFYFPLAAAAMVMIFSVNVVNSALSGTPDAKTALAAFAIGFSYAEMMSAPCFAGMSMLITLGRDRIYFANTIRFMLKIMVFSIAGIALLAFTPFGKFVALELGGASLELYSQIRVVWLWTLLLPFIFIGICTSRAVILVERATIFVTLTRVIRLGVMFGLAALLPRMDMLDGATIGALIMLGGMGTEAIIGAFPAVHYYRKWPKNAGPEVPIKEYPPTQLAAFKFLGPLIITSLMWGISRPVLYAGLARLENPELTIATYKVATNFIWLFMVFIEDNIKQVTVAFLRTHPEHKRAIIRFTIAVCFIVVTTILIAALTPLGVWMITNVIGVDLNIAIGCAGPMLVLAFYPAVQAIQEHFQARLLLKGRTQPLGIAKVCNIIVMGITVFSLAAFWPQAGPTAGAIGLTLGMTTEMLIMRQFALRLSA